LFHVEQLEILRGAFHVWKAPLSIFLKEKPNISQPCLSYCSMWNNRKGSKTVVFEPLFLVKFIAVSNTNSCPYSLLKSKPFHQEILWKEKMYQ
jgi:hypothetical protein